MSDIGGQRANQHGEDFRRSIVDLLLGHNFTELDRVVLDPDIRPPLSVFESQRLSTIEQPRRAFLANLNLLHRNCLHKKLYPAHFLLCHEFWPIPVALMARTQGGSGSADEKLEYMYRNMWNFPCRSLVLLDGFSRGVMERARDVVQLSRGKIAFVFENLGAFRRWLTDGARLPPENDQRALA